jgi:glycogen(starch) synthase
MKIVISSKSYYPLLGGSIVFAAMMAKAFTREGHEVVLITRTPGEAITDAGYPVIRQPSWHEKNRLAKWADVAMQIDVSWRDIIPFLWRRVLWVPTVHRGKPSYNGLGVKYSIVLAIESLGYKIGNTVGVSDYTVKSWDLRGDAIPNPYDNSVFYPPDASQPRDIDILFVGRITEDKGVLVLLEALGKLELESRRLRIAFVGQGCIEDELKLRSKKLHSRFDFLFPGMANSGEVADWMRRSRVLAFPTTPDWLEASPLTPLEATACGCIVVASDIGGTVENISPTHWRVRPGDADDLSQGLARALKDPSGVIDEQTCKFLTDRTLDKIASAYLAHFAKHLAPHCNDDQTY